MNKKFFSLLISLSFMAAFLLPLMPSALAQEDETQATLDRIAVAYRNAAALESYAAQASAELRREVRLSEGDNTLIVTTEMTTAQSAEVQGDDLSSTVEQILEQTQTLLDEPLPEGADLPEPNLTSTLELNAQLIRVDGQLYLNLDDTSPEYRVGVPEGWQAVTDTAAIASEAQATLDALQAALENVQVDAEAVAALLNTTVVTTLEPLEDGELDGQVMQRYLLTLNMAEVAQAQNLDLAAMMDEDASLSQAVLDSLVNTAVYTLEVWIGADDQTLHQHVISFAIQGDFPPGALEGDLSGSAFKLDYLQSNTLSLSNFNGQFEIAAPEAAAQ
jgi:type II secretory pathway pseudopilin PulG